MKTQHPVRRPEVQADIERWSAKLLSETGSATIVVEFNVKEGRFIGYRLGGSASRSLLEHPLANRPPCRSSE